MLLKPYLGVLSCYVTKNLRLDKRSRIIYNLSFDLATHCLYCIVGVIDLATDYLLKCSFRIFTVLFTALFLNEEVLLLLKVLGFFNLRIDHLVILRKQCISSKRLQY